MKKKGKKLCEGKQQSMKIRIYEDFANINSTHTQMMQRKGMAKEKTKQNNKLTILETVLLLFGWQDPWISWVRIWDRRETRWRGGSDANLCHDRVGQPKRYAIDATGGFEGNKKVPDVDLWSHRTSTQIGRFQSAKHRFPQPKINILVFRRLGRNDETLGWSCYVLNLGKWWMDCWTFFSFLQDSLDIWWY